MVTPNRLLSVRIVRYFLVEHMLLFQTDSVNPQKRLPFTVYFSGTSPGDGDWASS